MAGVCVGLVLVVGAGLGVVLGLGILLGRAGIGLGL